MIWLLSTLALAQPAPTPEAPRVRYAERTEVNFERGLDIEGELVKPAISQVSEARRAAFASFIRLRVDFDDEIRSSAALVR